jgi:DNA-binding beta-propeller fold protein YncE
MRMTTWLVLLGVIAGVEAAAQETPSPALLVLHKGENAMAIVDPATGKNFGHVPTGQDPHELAVSTDGKLAFASNYAGPGPRGGNTLSVIDIAARKELHRVDLGSAARTGCGSPTGSCTSPPRGAWPSRATTRRATRSIGCSDWVRIGPT